MHGFENKIAIERKSLADMIGCCGYGGDRFAREMERMLDYKYRAIVIEGDWATIDLRQYRGDLNPKQIKGRILGFSLPANIAVHWAGDHARAGELVAQMLYIAANRAHREKLLKNPV